QEIEADISEEPETETGDSTEFGDVENEEGSSGFAEGESSFTEGTGSDSGTGSEAGTGSTGTAEKDVTGEEGEGKWEWDDGQREEIKDEFGDDFVTGAEFDPDSEENEDEDTTLSGEPEGTATEVGDGEPETGLSGEDSDATKTDEEDWDTGDATEEEENTVTDEADGSGESEDVSSEPEDVEEDNDVTEFEESPRDLILGIIEEDAGDEGVGKDEIKQRVVDKGVSDEECEEILEDLMLEGMCYSVDSDRIKPI
ncbi:MAG: hypothetical protein ABEK59_13380, partial [Halobacteria archaeon]